MKLLAPFALLTVASLMATPLLAAEASTQLTGCAAKRQDIATQLEHAKAQGDSEQQAGLETALQEVTAHCTEASLKKQRENRVLDAKHEVSRRRADLDKAMSQGDSDKINKRKDKLAESRKELHKALRALDQ